MTNQPEIYRRHPEELTRDLMRAQEWVKCFEGMEGGAPVRHTVAEMIPVEEWGHHLFQDADPDDQLMFRVCECDVAHAREWIVDLGNVMVDGKRTPDLDVAEAKVERGVMEDWWRQDKRDKDQARIEGM